MFNKFIIISLVFLVITTQKSFCTELDECPIPLYAVISHGVLLQHFKKERLIGGGGEASVYSVEHLTCKKSYALVIKHELVERAPLIIENLLLAA